MSLIDRIFGKKEKDEIPVRKKRVQKVNIRRRIMNNK